MREHARSQCRHAGCREKSWVGRDKIEAVQWLKRRMKRENRWEKTSHAKNPAKDRDHQRTVRVQRWLDNS